jgi:hypothetical protein
VKPLIIHSEAIAELDSAIASFDPSTAKRFHSQPLFHRRWLAGEQAIALQSPFE